MIWVSLHIARKLILNKSLVK